MPESVLTLRTIIAKSISTDPTLPHSVEDSGGAIRLACPKQSDTGFDIALQVSAGTICIETRIGWHNHDESEAAAAVTDSRGETKGGARGSDRMCVDPHAREK